MSTIWDKIRMDYSYRRNAFREGMLALPYRFRKFNGTWWFNMCRRNAFREGMWDC